MAMFGFAELVLLVLFGGGVMGGTPDDLKAPHDSAKDAIQYVLPGAQLAIHGNVEASTGLLFQLVSEVEALGLVRSNNELRGGIAQARMMMRAAFDEGKAQVGLDLSRDVGSFTASVEMKDAGSLRFLVRARGNFGSDKLRSLLKGEMTPETYGKFTLYALPEGGPTSGDVVCLPDETTVLLGDRALVQELLDGKKLKDGAARKVLAGAVRKGDLTFLYATAPAGLLDELDKDKDTRRFGRFLAGMAHVVYTTGSQGARLVFKGTSESSTQTAYFLCKAAASALAAADPAIDALTFGMLGIAPLASERDVEPEILDILADEKGILELSTWVKKRAVGKANASWDKAKGEVTLRLTNPAALAAMMLPLGGAWYILGDAGAEPPAVTPEHEPVLVPIPDDGATP